MSATDELSAADDRTIQFRLKKPFPLLPMALGKSPSPMCAMMPERLANTDPFKQITEMLRDVLERAAGMTDALP
jgi:peptide/nickel transport system substrate-binding protein